VSLPIQRCTVHKHCNLLVHALKPMHDELTEDCRGMIYADTPAEIEKRRKAFLRKWHPSQVAPEVPYRRR
jgi:putative transposase